MLAEDKRRQEAIFEVINTERKFMQKCQLVLDKYVGPMKEQKIVDAQVHACIFSEIAGVHHHSVEFLAELEKRQKDEQFVISNIGRFLLSFAASRCLPHLCC